ncbi:beta-ketoacyl synthase N-terminal-like domain-containing protein [Aliamphritea spongicola]|nr:beta-ketoacyl synthase N-terminal-like domain-containing protein [Aliamphritea spongicola]
MYGISTACSSGAKALATARRLIRAGVCDAVIAGGVDSICRLTVQGFNSLEAVSTEVCNPFSANRKGINIGEGGALFVVSNEPEGRSFAVWVKVLMRIIYPLRTQPARSCRQYA